MSLAIIKDYEPIELMYIEIFEKDPENKDPKSFRHIILPYINSLTIFKDKTKYITRIDISTKINSLLPCALMIKKSFITKIASYSMNQNHSLKHSYETWY